MTPACVNSATSFIPIFVCTFSDAVLSRQSTAPHFPYLSSLHLVRTKSPFSQSAFNQAPAPSLQPALIRERARQRRLLLSERSRHERTCYRLDRAAMDPQRPIATVYYRTAKGLFDHLVGGGEQRIRHGFHSSTDRSVPTLNHLALLTAIG